MDVFVITGASKGIGLALTEQLIQKNHLLICTARTKKQDLINLAHKEGCELHYFECDLSNSDQLENLMDQMVSAMPEFPSSVTLINNAGIVEPIARAENCSAQSIEKSISVNLIAPMILTSAFIKGLENKHVMKRVINISSGAGRNPYSGWSSYCTGKAGLDHFSRVIAMEQKHEPFGVKIISIAPGIIDTEMQEQIRQSHKDDFELIDRFIRYKEEGLLNTPEETARELIRVIKSERFNELDVIQDLRHMMEI